MSKPASRFGGLSAQIAGSTAQPPPELPRDVAEPEGEAPERPRGAKARVGKKVVAGHFSDELSRRLRTLAAAEGTTVQALLGEALDLLFTARQINRFGER